MLGGGGEDGGMCGQQVEDGIGGEEDEDERRGERGEAVAEWMRSEVGMRGGMVIVTGREGNDKFG